VRAELCRLRGALIEIAESQGKHIVAAGTHPFSRWMEQTITPRLRYKALEENMQDIAPTAADFRDACACGHRRLGADHRHLQSGRATSCRTCSR
jgi:carboxylate-amine ligase